MFSPQRLLARGWIGAWWPKRRTAEDVLLDYRASHDDNIKMWADLARFCNAGDSSLDPDPVRLAANEGRREVWLHMQSMAKLDERDTQTLLEETEE